ncbi:EXS family-domain-containing protein [Pyronema omphalodes]|nr:EXS family-domain-containing protein [Pyronema omphalodes]
MKFAKTLEDVMVPEWRTKYVEYKQGKKRIKATTNNLRIASPSPAINALRRTASKTQSRIEPKLVAGARRVSAALASPNLFSSAYQRKSQDNEDDAKRTEAQGGETQNTSPPASPTALNPTPISSDSQPAPIQVTSASPSTISPISALPPLPSPLAVTPQVGTDRYSSATLKPPSHRRHSSYGSLGYSPGYSPGSPHDNSSAARAPSLLLPEPIQPIGLPGSPRSPGSPDSPGSQVFNDDLTLGGPALSVKSRTSAEASRPTLPRAASSNPRRDSFQPPLVKRIFTLGGRVPAIMDSDSSPTIEQVQAEAEKEFLKWLLGELKKCEDFYVSRETAATRRFEEMREQLDIMRERWWTEKHGVFEEDDCEDMTDDIGPGSSGEENGLNGGNGEGGMGEFSETEGHIGHAHHGHGTGNGNGNVKKRVGWKTFTEAMNGLSRSHATVSPNPLGVINSPSGGTRDYVRRAPIRKPLNNPAHRVAKRKLKKAFIEFYHGLEMLKSYVTVNRECFRKITKKFDKASGLRTSHRFMTEYVDKSRFGAADNELDDLLNDTENLFARFFERGNRKEASARLRSRESKTVYYASVWRSGFYIGLALVIAAYGLYNAVVKLSDPNNPERAVWGGIPALISVVFAICFWFSSHDFWDGRMDMIYWPVIFVGIFACLLLNPFRVFYYHSRKWMFKTLWRLACSGAYPVEFKDFWMGDMLCSQTYALGNIALFFCLYSHSWNNPTQCNSNHSRLMGFFTTLPSILRLLQCLRRYYNSKMAFPHLANGGKYLCTILHYTTLSIWRLHISSNPSKAIFITFASINSIYTTIWDIAMDWSLLDPGAPYPFLRKSLGFKKPWPYYMAMFIDPILRCIWFFYIIYADQVQHSALLSFVLSLAEVLRRFMWAFFRMENEHVGNVDANRAYREIPLPYHLPASTSTTITPTIFEEEDLGLSSQLESQQLQEQQQQSQPSVPILEIDLERMDSGLRRRASRKDQIPGSPLVRTMTRVGRTMNQAHLQDYERRRNREEEIQNDSDSEEEEEEGDYYERTRETRENEGRLSVRRSTAASIRI